MKKETTDSLDALIQEIAEVVKVAEDDKLEILEYILICVPAIFKENGDDVLRRMCHGLRLP